MTRRLSVRGVWTTAGPTGLLHWSSTGLHLTKREAIRKFMARIRRKTPLSWPRLRRLGYRAVQVTLRELPS